MGRIIITGAGGFVGRHLTTELASRNDEVVAIARAPRPAGVRKEVRWVEADLLERDAYASELEGAAAVVHLAATTGKARPATFQRNNVDATRALVEACQASKPPRFVFVSSIAAGYADRRYYPYADSKLAAEQLVLESGLNAVIVRPTMVLGEGSPIEQSLSRLAALPVVPMFGSGKTRVQPVDVGDVVKVLTAVLDGGAGSGEILEVGGPEVFTMQELMARLRPGSRPRFLHLPLGILRTVLAWLERPLLGVLPLTAGQLAAFANDSAAQPNPFLERLLPNPTVTPAKSSAPTS